MANNYNAYFPQTYTPYAYGAQSSLGQNYTTPQTGAITWVQGEAGARSINVPAGQTSLLMDSEANIFYIKSSDVSGIPLPLRKFKYEEVVSYEQKDARAPSTSTYITKEELDKRLEEFASQFTNNTTKDDNEKKIKEDNSDGKFNF